MKNPTKTVVCLWLIVAIFQVALAGVRPRFKKITLRDGLTQSTVRAFAQDGKGVMWMGTIDGLNRFDGYKVTSFRPKFGDPNSLGGARIEFLLTDALGRLWVGLTTQGLDYYDGRTGRFKHHRQAELGKFGPSEDRLSAGFVEDSGTFLIGTINGYLDRFDPKSGRFKNLPFNEAHRPLGTPIRSVYVDGNGRIWLGLRNDGVRISADDGSLAELTRLEGLKSDQISMIRPAGNGQIWICYQDGISLIDENSLDIIATYTSNGTKSGVPGGLIVDMVEDDFGNLWFGSPTGFARLDRQENLVEQLRQHSDDPYGLSQDHIAAVFKDRDGRIWVGTNGVGACYFDPAMHVLKHYDPRYYGEPDALDPIVWGIAEDQNGHIWVGTNKAGLVEMDPKSDAFQVFKHDENDESSLAPSFTRSLTVDRRNRVWVSNWAEGLSRLDAGRESFVHYKFNADQPNSLSNDYVISMHQDQKDRLWFGTFFRGLNLLTDDEQGFRHFLHDANNPASLSSNRIWDIDSSAAGILWLATGHGLNALDPESGEVTRYLYDPNDLKSLSHNVASSVLIDSKQRVWIGTNLGLNVMTEDGVFKVYSEDDGLPNNFIYSLEEDDDGGIWLSTNEGLARLDPDTGGVRTFTEQDGLQSNEFNAGSSFKGAGGVLYFGGINGFNMFDPSQLPPPPTTAPILLTDILRLNQPLTVRTVNRHSPLDAMADEVTGIQFGYEDYLIGFEFAALDFMDPEGVTYAYQLEGFDKDWIYTSWDKRFATYTSLPPGDYRFRIKAASRNASWREMDQMLAVEIMPPWWRTHAAYVVYFFLICMMVWLFLYRQARKLARQRDIAAKERRMNQRLREVDKLKDEFLANTSHELRTPLNGIIGLTESLLDGATGALPEKTCQNLSLIASSGRRLAALVNDILDFSKLRTHDLVLSLKPVDLRIMVDVVVALSRPLIGTKDVQLENQVPHTMPPVVADENRLQQILHNLVGNAIKFTEKGRVVIYAEVHGPTVTVTVEDSGIGIRPEDRHRIFESFEQVSGESTRVYGGTGLGLALTRRLVGLHGGTMSLESVPGEGSRFLFSLPVSLEPLVERGATLQGLRENLDSLELHQNNSVTSDPTEPIVDQQDTVPWCILIVDDEPINRQVFKNHLSLAHYQVLEACDGPEALEMAKSHAFDLVLLDVMMPRMSGYEVCRKLREQFTVNELPILFLTARNQVLDLKEAFKQGANDYLTKPVSKDELLSRVKTHLELLDVHRNLEQRVADRTQELQSRNQELDERNREILETRDQLILQEKMASLGTLTAGIAHEIRNPLNFINGFAEVSADLSQELRTDLYSEREALKDSVWEEMDEQLQSLALNNSKIQEHGQRANQIVQSMVVLAKGESGEREETDINELVATFVDLAWQGRSALWQDDIPIVMEKSLDEDVGKAEVIAQGLSRAIICLVNNGLEALAEGFRNGCVQRPKLTILTRRCHESLLEICIVDNGPGIDESIKSQVFTPFFTTRSDKRNVGLGLTLCHEIIVREHGGLLTIQSKPGETQVIIQLPTSCIKKPVPKKLHI